MGRLCHATSVLGRLDQWVPGRLPLYVNDSYVFHREIAINYEHSLCGGGKKGQKTDCIVWYYLRDPTQCNLRLTDELDVGDAASEKAHQYAVTGEIWSGRTESAYDACEQGPPYPVTDHGRAFSGKSTFTIKLDPGNQGVKLRRRLNRNLANVQLAKVYVDEREIPDTPWYFCDLPAPAQTAFADTDFEIPATYTRGKSRISITVEHVKASDATPVAKAPAAPKSGMQRVLLLGLLLWPHALGKWRCEKGIMKLPILSRRKLHVDATVAILV